MSRRFLRTIYKFLTVVIACIVAVQSFAQTAWALERYEILKIGDKDKYVLELQKALYNKGYLKHKPTGYFGTDTQNAVIAFQKDSKLRVDGKAGPETRKAVFGSGYAAITSERKVQDGNDTAANKYTLGDKGDEIKEYQKLLMELEYYSYSKTTGYFGPITELAVKRFQRTNGLEIDGVIDGETEKLLKSGDAKYFTIYPGEKSEDVKKLQQRLKELKYFNRSITGYFGSETEAAVKAFQSANKLKADGKAGKNTRKILYSPEAKENAGGKAEEAKEKAEEKKESASKQSKIQKMLDFAKEQLGKKYVRSREGPDSFDCSGLVYYVIKYMGIKTRRYSADGFMNVSGWTKITSTDLLKPGDLLFWKNGGTSKRAGHTGIYLGDGKFIHASSTKKSVIISALKGYYTRNFLLARRVL